MSPYIDVKDMHWVIYVFYINDTEIIQWQIYKNATASKDNFKFQTEYIKMPENPQHPKTILSFSLTQ